MRLASVGVACAIRESDSQHGPHGECCFRRAAAITTLLPPAACQLHANMDGVIRVCSPPRRLAAWAERQGAGPSDGGKQKRDRRRSVAGSSEPRQDVLCIGLEEGLLLAADLLHVEVVDAGVGELLQRGDVLVEVGAAGHRVGHHLLGH
jgi:hypothetical protein